LAALEGRFEDSDEVDAVEDDDEADCGMPQPGVQCSGLRRDCDEPCEGETRRDHVIVLNDSRD
jgi:hypothetical protein